ncbi:MAG: aldehyde dehydrogenase (NADP(+)) [Flavobacteriia bacterium]|jgi:alpha-ketoglutaric semialdehyde dehydrogenase
MKILGKSLIGYSESVYSDKSFKTFNPVLNRENDFEIFSATELEIELAVNLASSCFTEYSTLSGESRAGFLLKIAQKLDENRTFLKEIYCLESALPENRAEVELNRTIHQLREFADLLTQENWNFSSKEDGNPDRQPNPKPELQKYLKALGLVVVFGASNFPFAYSTIGGDSASALAAGCPVIVKAHPMHAGTGDLVAQLVVEAAKETGMPEGVFANLNGIGNELGQKLVLHPKIKAVGFTGSFQGGMAIHKLAQTRFEPVPVFAEMGSVNPIFLFESAFEQKDLVEKFAQSISLNAGQFCTNPGLIILMKSVKSTMFIETLAESLQRIESQAMVHPNLWKNYRKNAQLIGGQNEIIELVETKELKDNFISPLLRKTTAKSFLENDILQEEVFGSHTLIVEAEDSSQILEIVNKIHGQLTLSIFADPEELKLQIEFLRICEQKAGRLIFNGVPTGVEVCQAMHHGGPFPATTDSRFTAVGKDAIYRFLRPVSFQNFPSDLLALMNK